jgi:hypothetical protein
LDHEGRNVRSISNVARRRDDGLGATNSGPYSFAVRVIVDGALDDGQLLGALRFPRSPALADTWKNEPSCRCFEPGGSMKRDVVSELRESVSEKQDDGSTSRDARLLKRGDVSALRAVVLLFRDDGNVLLATRRL